MGEDVIDLQDMLDYSVLEMMHNYTHLQREIL